jgi:hypothetical protein
VSESAVLSHSCINYSIQCLNCLKNNWGFETLGPSGGGATVFINVCDTSMIPFVKVVILVW